MPIYEYICKKCGHEFDEIQKFSDPPIKKCPKCSGKVEKKLSLPSFQLKGTGWYVTDFKDKPKKAEQNSTSQKEESKTSPEKKEPPKKEEKKS
jgi:putative FmdB family regulatory protein